MIIGVLFFFAFVVGGIALIENTKTGEKIANYIDRLIMK